MHKRSLGSSAEQYAKQYLENQGWKTIVTNFTIRGGEIDLIMTNSTDILFVEVKIIDAMHSLEGYITKKKHIAMKRAIQAFLWRTNCTLQPRIDVIFVKGGKIYTIVENCTDF